MKIACISLGCPKNQVDLDVMVHILLSAGHETVADLAEADVILVNTCGFIESAKTEAIENILEACSYKQQNPELKVIVTGRALPQPDRGRDPRGGRGGGLCLQQGHRHHRGPPVPW